MASTAAYNLTDNHPAGAPETTRGRGGRLVTEGQGFHRVYFTPSGPPARMYTPSFEHIPHSRKYGGQ